MEQFNKNIQKLTEMSNLIEGEKMRTGTGTGTETETGTGTGTETERG